MDGLRDWTGTKRYGQIHRAAERRDIGAYIEQLKGETYMGHLQPTAVDARNTE